MTQPRSWTWQVLILAMVILVVGGGAFTMANRAHLQRQVEQDLFTVARLKADQVTGWYHERQSDAKALSASLSLSADALGMLGAHRSGYPLTETQSQVVRDLFEGLRKDHGYADILFVDPAGEILISLANQSPTLDKEAQAILATAIQVGAPQTDDLHACAFDRNPHISIMAPVSCARGSDKQAVGAVVLIIEVRSHLFPLIQTWPRHSRTAESVLVRQEGDSVVFLNDLRLVSGTALRLRFPMSQKALPAVRAIRGEQGIMKGVDYRGVEVLTAFLPVPGTPWFIGAKEDTAEALSVLRHQSALILLLIAALLVLAGTGLILLLQREKRTHFRVLSKAEHQLASATMRHQVILQSIGDAVIATDRNGRVELMNPEAERQTGYSLSEAIGRPLEEVFRIINEETRAPVESPVTRVLRELRVVGLANHTVLLAKDGTEHPIADSGAPIQEADGSVSGVVLVFRDQTEERVAQRDLEASELRFRATFKLAAVGCAHVATDGRFQRINKKFCELLGYSRDEMLQKKIQEITHPDDLAVTMEHVRRMFSREQKSFTCEKRYIRKDGSFLWAEVTATLIWDATGHPAFTVAIAQDITQRKQNEIERSRLLSAIEQANDSIIITDTQARILYVNPAFEHNTGYTRDEVMGMNPSFLKSGKHDADFYLSMWRILTAGEVFKSQMVNRRKDGQAIIEFVTITPVRNPAGDVENYVAVKRDVTQESNLEEQLRQAQKMEAVGRLAGGVAHDFNNILQALLGYGNMLQEVLVPGSDEADYASEIVRSGERAAGLTRQLLAFSRKQVIAPRVLDVNDTVVGMLKLLRRLIGENIELRWTPAANLRPIRMDPEQVNQILANLVVNARDAIEDTGLISIETASAEFDTEFCAQHEGSNPGQYAVLLISDTGTGMDEITQARIFEPFFTTKDLGQGTGLGLSTVYGIVKQNGGYIHVSSSLGQGTTFHVYLPLVEPGVEVEVDRAGQAVIQAGKETILLVEDELPLLRFAENLLQGMGYTVLATDSPVKAVELARSSAQDIQLLLTDVVMPGMSGRDLHVTLAAEKPDLKCLYISGYTSDIIADRGVLEEGVHFLAKPFTRGELASKLRLILDA